ncbi:unnamed protein product [Ilex paraguariensis]|uniref:Exoribonuclease phosphorolytic domain-containing protein n=1 Tax=Ilex paraguariensis TaxID=185542 RepID=A0ABC8TA89_9AQUA
MKRNNPLPLFITTKTYRSRSKLRATSCFTANEAFHSILYPQKSFRARVSANQTFYICWPFTSRTTFALDLWSTSPKQSDILVETGHIGRQASGAVTVTDGETIIYTSVCLADVSSEPSDFFPLYVNYQERFSAAGRTSGGFFKREGRTKDHEVLSTTISV